MMVSGVILFSVLGIPASRILISLLMAFLNYGNVYSRLLCSRAKIRYMIPEIYQQKQDPLHGFPLNHTIAPGLLPDWLG